MLFHLRPGVVFSDGTPITADDVVRNGLRLLDPANPSPLASLLADVVGADEYMQGKAPATSVGFRASGNDVEVKLVRPSANDFVAVAACPSLAVAPPSVATAAPLGGGAGSVGSGGYTVSQVSDTALVLTANDRYWAGPPPIRTVRLVLDIGGRGPVDAFAAGDVDYAPIGPYDSPWIAYDPSLGPQLRSVAALVTDYVGFDTAHKPFDDVRVRRAFALAVDWRRVVRLSSPETAVAATSMVPVGIPGRGGHDFGPSYDPAAARQALAEAGYPGGAGFPSITLTTTGYPYDAAAAAELHDVLGIQVSVERMAADEYFTRLGADPPAFWALSWVADYPSPNDFLGVLLGSGRTSNYSRWRSTEFDAAIADATSATSAPAARAAYDRAEAIVQRDVPVIPLSYSTEWALARTGLRGASQNGLGFIRFAGLAWSGS